MSRLFLAVLLAGAFCLTTAASADTPKCHCTYWDMPVDNCLVTCPGQWGDARHAPGTEMDWVICLMSDDLCTVPLVGFDCLRLWLGEVCSDSICVCEEECPENGGVFPYVYPVGPTDVTGCTSFRWEGTILALPGDDCDNAYLQVCGCPDDYVYFRSPDVNADCVVGLADFVIFAGTGGAGPPAGFQKYTVYVGHCSPMPWPTLADFVIFAGHFGHQCIPGPCDPTTVGDDPCCAIP